MKRNNPTKNASCRTRQLSVELKQLQQSLGVAQLRPEAVNFVRGNCYLECYQAAGGVIDSAAVAFSKNALATEVVNAVADNYYVDAKIVKEDAKFALQVRTIVGNCGEQALAVILRAHSTLKVEDVGIASRMHAERQRYEMQQAAQGKPIGQKPIDGTPAYDTHGFNEIVSRMARFNGLLANQVAAFTDMSVLHPNVAEVLPAELEALIRDARQLRQMVKARDSAPALSVVKKRWHPRKPTEKPADPSVLWSVVRRVHGVVNKCLRDISRMPASMLPTAVEKRLIDGKLKSIEKDSKCLLSRHK